MVRNIVTVQTIPYLCFPPGTSKPWYFSSGSLEVEAIKLIVSIVYHINSRDKLSAPPSASNQSIEHDNMIILLCGLLIIVMVLNLFLVLWWQKPTNYVTPDKHFFLGIYRFWRWWRTELYRIRKTWIVVSKSTHILEDQNR